MWKAGWRGGTMGTAGGIEGTKATGGTEGTEATGIGTGGMNGWEGAAKMGLGCGARTDLETSSNHRSASEGVRLWEEVAGEDVGGTTITGVGVAQSPPVSRNYKNEPQTSMSLDKHETLHH